MSLDVYLNGDTTEVECICPNCDNKHARLETDCLYSSNITHNLGKMADEAGIYKCLWRPEELGVTKAKELIEGLRAGLLVLKGNPEKFKQFNPDNGWGTYEGLVTFVEAYLDACIENPDAEVSVSR